MAAQIAPADQQNLHQSMVVGGGSGTLDVPALKVAAGQTNVYQFTKDFQIVFGQGMCSFRHGGVYALHAPLKAALIAMSAPMIQL
jgi:hypothetical protein